MKIQRFFYALFRQKPLNYISVYQQINLQYLKK